MRGLIRRRQANSDIVIDHEVIYSFSFGDMEEVQMFNTGRCLETSIQVLQVGLSPGFQYD